MKAQSKAHRVYSTLSVFGLALLLLLSPCKVRNFVQNELGIPITKTSNKSQSVKQSVDCLSFEVSKTLQTELKQNAQQSNFTLPGVYSIEHVALSQEHALIPYTSRPPSALDVPLYILYQNILVYS